MTEKRLAADPPEDASFLVTQLWDKHLPRWRQIKAEKEPRDKSSTALFVSHHSKVRNLEAQFLKIVQVGQFMFHPKLSDDLQIW